MQIDRDDQEKAAMCQTILQNIIVSWNYIRLTQIIMEADEQNKHSLIENITNGSILTWKHVNMLGIYDFRNLALQPGSTNTQDLLTFRL